MKSDIHLIGGPTASGKTAKALEIAQQQPSVIINADSMQLYRGLPLLTAQPTDKEKTAAPHKLFEILEPRERGSVGVWLTMAEKEIQKARMANLTPILVGGTGLYFQAIKHGLAAIPDIPQTMHDETAALYDQLGHDAFREKLAALDATSSSKIEKNDRQRLIRAYEVVEHTGKSLNEWHESQTAQDWVARFTIHHHLIMPDREELYARCDARFLKMMKDGALNEVSDLMAQNLDPTFPAMKVLGVRELSAHLRDEMTLDEAIAKAQQATRNYAKRQMTWFRNQWKSE